MKNALRPLVVAAALAVALCAGCVRTYKVTIVNELEVPVVLELLQYHSEGFGGTPPRAFTSDLLLETRRVSLSAGESATAVFNDAAGGHWVQWHLLEPAPLASEIAVLDLIRDERSIRVPGRESHGV